MKTRIPKQVVLNANRPAGLKGARLVQTRDRIRHVRAEYPIKPKTPDRPVVRLKE